LRLLRGEYPELPHRGVGLSAVLRQLRGELRVGGLKLLRRLGGGRPGLEKAPLARQVTAVLIERSRCGIHHRPGRLDIGRLQIALRLQRL
jgi:hypothetical protein